jgi:hypothetical protein
MLHMKRHFFSVLTMAACLLAVAFEVDPNWRGGSALNPAHLFT